MTIPPLVLGIDLGTSGVRAVVIDERKEILQSKATAYRRNLSDPSSWTRACQELIQGIPARLRKNLKAVSVDGTSGTLLACNHQGVPLGEALTYSQACPEQEQKLRRLTPKGGAASSRSGSLARALRLVDQFGPDLLLRHQADWVTGWLLNDWRWGEEGNNLRLGWDLETSCWIDGLIDQTWSACLPAVVTSGSIFGRIATGTATELGLPDDLLIVAGTTDSNAAVLAAEPDAADGVTVLGTTLVMKRFTEQPLQAEGVTRHRVGGRWLCGGASNAGAGVLRRFFNDAQLAELSRQIDPETDSGLFYRPLPGPGERFPVDDPTLAPVLAPRPVSDALYLHGLLEGLAEIELQGWRRLMQLGAELPERVISIGGGARNPQWRRLRERRLCCPVVSCNAPPAAGVARLALEALQSAGTQ